MTFGRSFCLLFLLLAGASDALLAQTRQIDIGTRPTLQAHHVQAPVSVDGRLNETAWRQAEAVSAFMQSEPEEGAPASQKTEVRVLYGPSNVYIGAFLFDDEASGIQQTLGRRDDFNRADWFVISLDSYFDQKSAYVFGVNAAGVQYDAIRTGGGGPGRGMDESWNAVWTSNVQVTSEGWVVEIRIPYSMLRFARANTQSWGIHFERRMPRRGEQVQWPLVRRAERNNQVANYGILEGLDGLAPRRNVQVQPYTVSRLRTEENPDQPGEIARDGSVDAGGDLKIGLGSNITLDATINPDFGQVDADPAELNLTAFETFFSERRPFFVEGAQIYEFRIGQGGPGGGGNLLYTRRIGAETPIIGATKLSGRTARGLSFGVLGAMTGDDFNPGRQYGVARLSQQFQSLSSIGGILTVFNGSEDDMGPRSLAGGADWDLRFRNNTYSLSGLASFTHRRWSEGNQAQETGVAASLRGAKRQGSFRYDLTANLLDDKYNPNDVGRLRRNNFLSLDTGIDYQVNDNKPFGSFQRGFIGFNTGHQWSYLDGLYLGTDLRFFSRWTLRSFRGFGVDFSVDYPFGGYDLFETRGLGPRAQPRAVEFGGEFQTDDRRTWQVEPEASLTFMDDGGREFELSVRGNWDVGSRLALMADIEAEWESDVIAWSSNETFLRGEEGWWIGIEAGAPDDLGPDYYVPIEDQGGLDNIFSRINPFINTEGHYFITDRHYYVSIFGVRDTRSIDFTLRGSITFTRNLSLQIYGQLFVARGRYADFQILQDRDTLVPVESFPKRDDFAFSSFQSNTVLRWEYRPGSTLFLVWTHGRRAEDELNPLAPWGASPYNTPMDRQIADAFNIIPNNVFLIKLNYTFLR